MQKMLRSSHPSLVDVVLKKTNTFLHDGHTDLAFKLYYDAIRIDVLNAHLVRYGNLGRFEQAIDAASQALRQTENIVGHDDPAYAASLEELACLHLASAHYVQAKPLLAQAMSIRRKSLGRTHPDYCGSLEYMATVNRFTGDYSEAEQCLREAVELREQLQGDNAINYAGALSQLADHLVSMGSFEEAQALYEKGRGIAISLGADANSIYAHCTHGLACIHRDRAEYSHSETLFNEALQIQTKNLGEHHPWTLLTKSSLASLYKVTGRCAEARSIWEHALSLGTTVLKHCIPLHIEMLRNLGDLYIATGDYATAEPLLVEAVRIQRVTLGEDEPSHAENLRYLGRLAGLIGDYARQLDLSEQVLNILQNSLGRSHPRSLSALCDVANACATMGMYSRAEENYVNALNLAHETDGTECLAYVYAELGLASLHNVKGAYHKAEPMCEHVSEVLQRVLGERHPYYAGTLETLLSLHVARGRYADAKAGYDNLIRLRQDTLGESHYEVGTTFTMLGELYLETGQYSSAATALQKAMGIVSSAFGETGMYYAHILNDLGQLAVQTGDYARAESMYARSLSIVTDIFPEDHPERAIVLENLACLCYETGDLARAQHLLSRSKACIEHSFGREHPLHARLLSNLGLVSAAMGRYENARDSLQQAILIRRKLLGKDHYEYAMNLRLLASVQHEIHEYDIAEERYVESAALLLQLLGREHLRYAEALADLGWLYADTGRLAQAKETLTESLEIYRAVGASDHRGFGTAAERLGLILASEGCLTEALTQLQSAMNTDNHLIEHVFSMASEAHRQACLQQIEENFHCSISVLLNQAHSEPDLVRAAFELVLKRKGIALDALVAHRSVALRNSSPELEGKMMELDQLRMQIARQAFPELGLRGHVKESACMPEWYERKEQLEAEVAREVSSHHLESQDPTVDPAQIISLLPPDHAFVEFVRYRSLRFLQDSSDQIVSWESARYVAFVLLAGQKEICSVDLGRATDLETILQDHWNGLLSQHGTSRGVRMVVPGTPPIDNASVKLRETVFDPLIPLLAECRRVILAPDGALNLLAFETLPVADRYLVDDYHFSYVGTARDILSFAKRSRESQMSTPVVVAAPDFDLEATEAQTALTHQGAQDDIRNDLVLFPSLNGSREEGQVIADMLGVETPWEGRMALESRLKELRSPSILHVATHGFFLSSGTETPGDDNSHVSLRRGLGSRLVPDSRRENPLLKSGLALAGANSWISGRPLPPEAEDGIITAEDIACLDLLDTQLVVLSGCVTGLGEIRVGDGVSGFRRAFTIAGAKTVIASVCRIDDAITREFMQAFYLRILHGEGRSEALRNVQLDMKRRYPHPSVWGAFICQGCPDPLPKECLDRFRRPVPSNRSAI